MQISGIVEAQTGPLQWLIVQGHVPATLAFLVFCVAGNAEANRGPFDLAEAESELTAGYHQSIVVWDLVFITWQSTLIYLL